MPFTPCHAAAAIPLARRGLVPSAVIIGSMTPDFEYFLCFALEHRFGHTLPGLFFFCVPAGLVALLLFHRVLKVPMFRLLPLCHQERVIPYLRRFAVHSRGQVCRILVSLLAGAATHLVWDSFTHVSPMSTHVLPFLSATVVEYRGCVFRMCTLLQHFSTLFGGGLLLWWYLKWSRHAPVHYVPATLRLSLPRKAGALLLLAAGAALPAAMCGLYCLASVCSFPSLRHAAGRVVVVAMAAFAVELTALCVFLESPASAFAEVHVKESHDA